MALGAMWRLFALVAMLSTALAPHPAGAQVLELRGTVTNRGLATQPVVAGTSGSLTWRIADGGTSEELEIGEPLGGSGPARSIKWADSVLILSISAAGDTIAWIGRVVGDRAGGEYLILGGQSERQGGLWSVVGAGLATMALGAPPDSAAINSIVNATAALRVPVPLRPPPTASAFTAVLSNANNSWIVILLGAVLVVSGAAFSARHFVGRAARTAGSKAPGPGDIAIMCPTCQKRPLGDAREVWFMYGLLLVARYGSRTFIGCRYCTTQETLRTLAINAVAGWWCIPWGIATPFVVMQNLISLLPTSSKATLDAKLKAAGLNPDDIILDRDGLTRETRELIEAASYVLATAVLADGRQHPAELRRAIAILAQLTGNELPDQTLKRFISRGLSFNRPLSALSFELRQTLLTVAVDVALSDGVVAPAELAMLHKVAGRLGFGAGVVEQMFGELLGASEKSRGADDEARPRSRATEELMRAHETLGVRPGATMFEVKQAWRSLMLRYHPDRAGPDKTRQAAFTSHSQELNWAYDLLKRHAGGSAGSGGSQSAHAT